MVTAARGGVADMLDGVASDAPVAGRVAETVGFFAAGGSVAGRLRAEAAGVLGGVASDAPVAGFVIETAARIVASARW